MLFEIIFFVFGSIMGSFYHVVATRLSNEESIIVIINYLGMKIFQLFLI